MTTPPRKMKPDSTDFGDDLKIIRDRLEDMRRNKVSIAERRGYLVSEMKRLMQKYSMPTLPTKH
jgi:hypothetical protein